MAGVPFDPDVPRPFSQREDCMYLGTLANKDLLKCQMKLEAGSVERDLPCALLTQDIYKAAPFYSHRQFWQQAPWRKPAVPGAAPLNHYPPRSRAVDLSMVTADIEKAQPNSVPFVTNRRTDPLAPNYKLPSFDPPAFAEPAPERSSYAEKQAASCEPRDVMRLDDIHSGLPWRAPLWSRMSPREQNDIKDIEYALPNYHRRVKRPLPALELSRNSLQVADINGPKGFPGLGLSQSARTGRENPLAPVYKMSQTTTHPFYGGGERLRAEEESIGPVEGAWPKKLVRDNGEPQTSLFCKDIPGASPQRFKGQTPFNLYDPPEVTKIMSFHDPRDIDGAQAGSRLRRHRAATEEEVCRERAMTAREYRVLP